MLLRRRDVFQGIGPAREAARSFDWARTSLGAIDGWTEHTRTITDLCLGLDVPAMVCWGSELIQVYNEAGCRLMGTRHPLAMGQSARQCWGSVWDALSPGYERLAADGESITVRGTPLPAGPDGSATDSRYDLSFVPVHDVTGSFAAVLVIAVDATATSTWATRTRLMARLSARAAGARSEGAVCDAVCAELVREEPSIPFALVYLFEGRAAKLAGAAGMPPGGPLSPEHVALSGSVAGDDPWDLSRLTLGHEVRLDRPPVLARGEAPWPRRAVVRPLIVQDHPEPLGALVTGADDGADAAAADLSSTVAEVIAAGVRAARGRAELRWRRDELAAEIEARSRYTASVAHELRTPLNAIIAHAELLGEGLLGRLEPRQAKHVGRIATAAAHLLSLVDDILALSRGGREIGPLHLAETDPGGLVQELEELLRPLFRAKGLEFGVRVQEGMRSIRTDGEKVRQILLNLLSNAQKYTDSGAVEVVVSQGDDGSVSVSVMDTGRGIDEADQASVFEPFRRLANAGGTLGTGLGLHVSQSLARLLGGALTLRSRPGVGSTFTLHLPDVGRTRARSYPGPSPPSR